MNEDIDKAKLSDAIGSIFSGFTKLREDEGDAALSAALSAEGSEIGKAFKMIDEGNYDYAHVTVFSEAERVFEAILRQRFKSAAARAAVTDYDFYSAHIGRVIERHEGRSCHVDKARNIMRQLIRFLETGREIAFDPAAEYTYSHPKRVLTTHAGIVAFFEALRHLLIGRNERYLEQLLVIEQEAKAAEERDPKPTLERFLKRLDMLASLGEDHDGEGAAAPNQASIEEARTFLRRMETVGGTPLSTLTSDGLAVIEFHEQPGEKRTYYGSVTFDGAGGGEIYVSERQGHESKFYEGPFETVETFEMMLAAFSVILKGGKYPTYDYRDREMS